MEVRNIATGQVYTLIRQESDGMISLLSPSGEVVEQNVSAGSALLGDADGNVTACSEPQLAAEFEEVNHG